MQTRVKNIGASTYVRRKTGENVPTGTEFVVEDRELEKMHNSFEVGARIEVLGPVPSKLAELVNETPVPVKLAEPTPVLEKETTVDVPDVPVPVLADNTAPAAPQPEPEHPVTPQPQPEHPAVPPTTAVPEPVVHQPVVEERSAPAPPTPVAVTTPPKAASGGRKRP